MRLDGHRNCTARRASGVAHVARKVQLHGDIPHLGLNDDLYTRATA